MRTKTNNREGRKQPENREGEISRPELVDTEPQPWPIADTVLTLAMLPAMWVVTLIMRWRDEQR